MKRPILYLVVFFSLGIIISSSLFQIPIFYPILFAIIFIATALAFSKSTAFSHLNLYVALIFFGMAYYQNANILPANHISKLTSEESKKIFLQGVIVDDPVLNITFYNTEKTTFVLEVSSYAATSGWRKATGLVKVDLYGGVKQPLAFSDEVIVEGLLARCPALKNPGLFDYSNYMANRGIYSVLKVKENFFIELVGKRSSKSIKGIAYRTRGLIRDCLDKYLGAPYSGFLKAILIGDRRDLDEGIKDDFIKTGTVHILAISGLHVGLVGAILIALFGLLGVPRKINLILTLTFLIFYSFIAGSSPPIIRATVIFAIFVIGYLIERDPDILNSLAISAFLILLWNPKELFDPSFQLSFVSVASIIIFVPKIDTILGGFEAIPPSRSFTGKIRRYILKGVSVSIASWLGTWPLISTYFNIVSPVSVIANLFVIPMLFVLITASFIFLSISFIPNPFIGFAAYILSGGEAFLFYVNHRLSELPFAYFRSPSPGVAFSILYYALMSLLIVPRIYRRHLLLVTLLFFNVIIWQNAINFKDDTLRVTFLDVGQGDSIFVESPDGGHILIDGGSGGDEEGFDIGKSVIAPYLWNKGAFKIDAIIVTHFHEDHLGGLIYILKNFKVGSVIDNGAIAKNNKIYDEYIRTIKAKGVRRIVAGEGSEIKGSGGMRMIILNPQTDGEIMDSNDNSIVLKLVYKNFSILFCGDITEKTMKRLLAYGNSLHADIMKVPHHGGNLGNEGMVRSFFEQVSPKISITSVGSSDRYKTAVKNTSKIITYLNLSSYETKNTGAITIWTDEKGYKMEGVRLNKI